MSIGVAIVIALVIAGDMLIGGHRQPMGIMEIVWPVTALYLGPLGLWAYLRWGRPKSPRWRQRHRDPPQPSELASVTVGVSHCGAGCTVGDIAATWIVFAAGLTLLGLALPVEYLFDYALAFALGIAFQYFSIAPTRVLGVRDGLRAAIKAGRSPSAHSRSGYSGGWR